VSGVFACWQPRYAEHGVATFPVSIEDKKPVVRGWRRLGVGYSAQLALRFPTNDAFGFAAGGTSGITVLDIDTTDERVRDDAFARYGEPRVVVRTLSGHWHGWYRYNGEPRRIRPWPGKRVDILGKGCAIAPPSQGPRSRYEFIQGGLDDLDHLTKLRGLDLPTGDGPIPEGRRDDTLFRLLLREVKACDDFDTLLDVARTINMSCVPPLHDAQVVSKAKQAWAYEVSGNNWVGRKARASTDREEILALSHSPAAAMLLNLLRVSHPSPGAEFAIDQVKTAELLGWSRQMLRSSIETLIAANRLERTRYGGRGVPHTYQLCRDSRAKRARAVHV
jgi:Bifunctional DNA primase/polymerase, N-terminal/Primase C terminal 1 (PriCT-1)